MPQVNNHTAEQDKPFEVSKMILVSGYKTPEVLKPSKQSFNLPAPAVSSKLATVLRLWVNPIPLVGSNKPCADQLQLFVERIRVVGSIAKQTLGKLVNDSPLESCLNEGNFMWRSTACVDGERKTSAVCNCHEFRTLAPLGRTNAESPFLAEANDPSTEHSVKSSLPRSRKSLARQRNTRSSTPERTHFWKRRWTVLNDGYLPGSSDHWAPVRKTQSTPFMIALSECLKGLPRLLRGRPGLSRCWRKNGAMIFHCSSVNMVPPCQHYTIFKVQL